MVFHWSLSDRKSPQVIWILFSILAFVNNAEVWMVSTRPPTSKSSSPFNNPSMTVPRAPITIGMIVTLHVSYFFQFTSKVRLSYFSLSFSFILWSAGTANSTISPVFFFFFFLLIIIKTGRLAEIRWSICMSKSHYYNYYYCCFLFYRHQRFLYIADAINSF